ncbi:hypothetical protein AWH62_15570 [Maricaulis sp. W15]|uniref:hypothetical protein n=1 Tax=Maricaulis sp. W15 TaxID=1772333 RepID=UPI000948F5B4|nr:hypothetical protein [Maricaulis sp. W15]OLF79789.1 hypothetical protein AWH62_15570 [Maricaulis sp. W15]
MSVSGIGPTAVSPFLTVTSRPETARTEEVRTATTATSQYPAAGTTANSTASPGSSQTEPTSKALSTEESAAVSEFLRWANMTPAERIRAQYLEQEGLSEDSLAALPEEERERIEMEIQQRIRDALGGTADGAGTSQRANQAYQATSGLAV